MIRCIVIDDEKHAIDLLADHISKIPLLELQFVTTNPLEAFQYLQQKKTDLIFLDIQMPELDGMQLLKLLGGKAKVILTTAYAEHALEGYEHDIVDYLLKPIIFERFLKSVQKAINILTPASSQQIKAIVNEVDDDYIFVKTDGRNKMVRVLLKEIEYIEGLGNYVSMYTESGRIITLLTIRELEEKLPPGCFVRIHNSYLVPFNKIIMVEGNQLQIGKQKLPIGDAYKKAFMTAINNRIINGKK